LEDLNALGGMLLNEGIYNQKQVLSERAVRQMTEEGLGLFLDGEMIGTMSSRTFSHHGGGWTMLTIDPESRLVAVVFVPSKEEFVAESLHPTMRIIGDLAATAS